jgi:RNA polymerase sigma-70 factor (ECF subfamily)
MRTDPSQVSALVDRLTRGHLDAFDAVFECYRDRLLREVARDLAADRRLQPRFDASDVVQEVFADARRQVAGYVAAGSRVGFLDWLRGLARERRLKLVRSHLDAQRRTVKRQQSLPEDSWRHPPAPEDTPSRAAAAAEQLQRLGAALDRLRPEDREVIRLRVTELRSNREAAAILGLSPEAVAKRLERALRRLRETVTPRTDHPSGNGIDHG